MRMSTALGLALASLAAVAAAVVGASPPLQGASATNSPVYVEIDVAGTAGDCPWATTPAVEQ